MSEPTSRKKGLNRAHFLLSVGGRIAEARKAQGLSQAELGEKVGVKRRAVTAWESGEKPFDTVRLSEIAAALEVDPSALIGPGSANTPATEKALIAAQQAIGDAFESLGQRRRPRELRTSVGADVYRSAPIGLFGMDLSLKYTYINDWLAAINGRSVEEHIGRSIKNLLPDVAEGVESELQAVIDTGVASMGEVLAETPAEPEKKRLFRHTFEALRSEAGETTGVVGAVLEVKEPVVLQSNIWRQVGRVKDLRSRLANRRSQPQATPDLFRLVQLKIAGLGGDGLEQLEFLLEELLGESFCRGIEEAEATYRSQRQDALRLAADSAIARWRMAQLPVLPQLAAAGDEALDGATEPGQVVTPTAEDLAVVIVRGDSAEDFARDGQAALVDLAQPADQEGDLALLLTVKGTLHIKRRERDRWVSVNPDYPDLEAEIAATYRVVGVLVAHRTVGTAQTTEEEPRR